MRTPKIFALLLAVALLIVPASAHGGHHGHGQCRTAAQQQTTVQRQAVQPQSTQQPLTYQLCPVEGCTIAGRHFHDGKPYCGANHTGTVCDGSCLTRPLCAVEGCTQTGCHLHDGTTYCGAAHSCGWCDGSCQSHPLCTVEGCTQAGYHLHDGTGYCGGTSHSCTWHDCMQAQQGTYHHHGHH